MTNKNIVVIGVGSNINPKINIELAIAILSQHLEVIKQSSFITTKAISEGKQDNYINGALLVETIQNQLELKAWLRMVEKKLGRKRSKNKSAARTIDLDILTWNGKITDEDVYTRDFLQKSLLELCPSFAVEFS